MMSNLNQVPVNDLTRWDSDDLKHVTAAMSEVAHSGYFMLGAKTKALEALLGKITDGKHAVGCANGTDALVLALLGLGIQAGDHVATVANAGGYATGAILRIGAIPVLVDVDGATAQMSAESLKQVFVELPTLKAIIVTHLYGLMADIMQLSKIASSHGAVVVEDCAQSIGASSNSRNAGAWGDAATFSFYPTKNLGCLGDGGAVAFSDLACAVIAREIAQYGWSSRYVVSRDSGINSRLDEIQAAILLARMPALTANNSRRRSIIARYSQCLSPDRQMIWANDETFVGHLAVMTTPYRKVDVEKLAAANISTGVHYPIADHMQPAWKKYFVGVSLPNTEIVTRSIVTLPCFPLLTDVEVSRVCDVLSTLNSAN